MIQEITSINTSRHPYRWISYITNVTSPISMNQLHDQCKRITPYSCITNVFHELLLLYEWATSCWCAWRGIVWCAWHGILIYICIYILTDEKWHRVMCVTCKTTKITNIKMICLRWNSLTTNVTVLNWIHLLSKELCNPEKNGSQFGHDLSFYTVATNCTGWRRLIGSPELQIILHKRATKYRSLLQKMTYKDKGSYESSPPCSTGFGHRRPPAELRLSRWRKAQISRWFAWGGLALWRKHVVHVTWLIHYGPWFIDICDVTHWHGSVFCICKYIYIYIYI